MKPTSRQLDALGHIRDHCLKIADVVQSVGTQQALAANWQPQYLLTSCITVLGEAAKRLGPQFQARNPSVQWQRIIGMRNRLVHGYDEVDMKTVWETATQGVPELLGHIEAIMRAEGLLIGLQDDAPPQAAGDSGGALEGVKGIT